MKHMQDLTDTELLAQTEQLAKEERRLSIEVLKHLRELNKRKLFLSLGYASLFDYTVNGLKYSHGAAARRIQAMRLIEDCPQVAQSIQEGSLNLSTVSAVQTFLNREKKESGKS